MLKYLKIQNLAIIDSAELEMASGFVCLTGESGTGKSIFIESLLLLGGSRASSDFVRTGTDKAVIEAEFEMDPETINDAARAALEHIDGPQLILRREISKDGRSRAFINGVMVPIGLLQDYGEIAFEIYGQHGQQRLLKPSEQLALFDSQTGLARLAGRFEKARTDFMAALKNYWKEKEGESVRLREIDFLRVQIGEIADARISEEDEDLSFRLKKARNHEKIREDKQTLFGLVDERLVPDLKQSERCLTRLIPFNQDWQPYLDQISSAVITLAELRAELDENEPDGTEDDIEALEERENVLNRLFMKYGRDVQEVLAERGRLETELKKLEGASHGLDALWRSLCGQFQELSDLKKQLHQRRVNLEKSFSGSVKKGLKGLALKDADFKAAVEWSGWPDSLEENPSKELKLPGPDFRFLFSSNPDEPVKPLARVASGGELSRILLALINAVERPMSRLLVFDEVDAGLGGETAHTVGKTLFGLGRRHQVLCITHFAQVARFASQQIKIEKSVKKGRTQTELAVCNFEERVAELARLMGGDVYSEKLREHARSLLNGVA